MLEKPKSPKKIKTKIEKVKKGETFRLSCKKLFLTYSQCSLDLKEAVSQLKIKLINYEIISFMAAREQHKKAEEQKPTELNEKPGVHLHIFIETAKKVNITNCDRLHLFNAENSEEIFKGNYQSSKSKELTIDYILKDITSKEDENLFYSNDFENRISKIGNYESYEKTIVNLVKKGAIDDALELIEREQPFYYCKNHMSLEKSFRELYLKTIGASTKFCFKDFVLPLYIKENLEQTRLNNKSLILSGRSGCGKSKFMESYLFEELKLNPLVLNNLDAIRFYKVGINKAILFDDCSFKDCSREELIKLLDSEDSSTFSVKHGSIQIRQNTPRFLTTNNTLQEILGKHYKDEAVLRRILFVRILDEDNLYVIKTKKLTEVPLIDISTDEIN